MAADAVPAHIATAPVKNERRNIALGVMRSMLLRPTLAQLSWAAVTVRYDADLTRFALQSAAMAAQLRIKERRASDVTLLDLEGRLEIGDGDIEFAACVDALIRAGHRKVIVNLRDVVHIDSGGIGVLVSKQASLRRRGGDLKLVHLPDSTHRALAVTRLLTVLDTFQSESDALASFGLHKSTT
jgi:anti-sigma B factor antagonist